ncbi:Luciferin 4-monooxygenase [Frankliniella fusca]|uniref:Luciferin 4-monooxygenase n=1 Tax=Frankliniella fusca TaxID=407009 RepID=A0AAE1GSN1_9NEOP|nr:Luciferin 4-monooxygenase [Frankliniella fusca]
MTEIRVSGEAIPDQGLSYGDLALESLRHWQHRPEPTQIDAHFGTSMSFRELLVQTMYACEGFKAMGLEPKDVVALVSRNSHEMFPAVLGAVCAGLSISCVVPSATLTEMQHALNLTQPKVVISERDRVQRAMDAYPDGKHIVLSGDPPEGVDTFISVLRRGEAAEPRPDPDTYRAVDLGDRTQHAPFILFSSGTTGLPKAVMLKDSSMTKLVENLNTVMTSADCDPADDVLLISSPLCWISGVWQLLWGLRFGATRVFTTVSDDLTIMSAIDKFKVNTWMAAPAVLIALVSLYKSKYADRYDFSSLKRVLIGGSPTGAEVQASLQEDLQCNLIQVYGATEAGFVFGPRPSVPSPPGAMGKLEPGIELRLVNVDTGEDIPAEVRNTVAEVRIRSDYLMLGYFNNPEETEKALDEHGFYKSGDLVYEDDDGYFFFVDRIKEMIKYKNNQIAPAEVEMVLLQHPGVREACVLGRPSTADIGDVPTAFVSRADNEEGEALTEAELQDMVAAKLSDYKRLRGGVVFMDELPKTPINEDYLRSTMPIALQQHEAPAVKECAPAVPPSGGKDRVGYSTRKYNKLEVRVGREAMPDRGLSCGDLALESLRKWQHRSPPTQIDAHFATTMSYRELLVQTVHACEGFKAMGLKPMDIVAVFSRNCHEVMPAVLGAVCAGLSVACVVPSGTLAEVQHALNLTQPKVVISERDRIQRAMDAYPDGKHIVLNGDPPEGADTFLDVLRMGEEAEPRPDPDTYRAVDIGDRSQHSPFILYSSGTTGLPKAAVMLRDICLTSALSSGLLAHGNDQASTGILLVSSPLCWISGVFQYLWTLVHGQIRVLVPVSDPVSILASIDKFKITSWLTAPPVLFTVGSEYENKYKNHYDISSLKTIFLGGSSTGADVHTAMEEVFGCKIIQFYGSTETGGVFGSGSKIAPPGALGTLLSDVELRLVNIDTGEDIPANVKNAVGEVRVRSKNLMLGYYKNPEATAEAFDEHGFFKTGDLAYEDEDGYFYFVDRIKEMIKYMNYQPVRWASRSSRRSAAMGLTATSTEPPVTMTSVRTSSIGLRPDEGLSCGDMVLESMRRWRHLSKPAQIDAESGTSMTFRDLLVQTVHAAEGFKAMGLKPKDIMVLLVGRNCHEMVPALLGAVCAGLSVACVFPVGTAADMQHAFDLARPKMVISERDCLRTAMDAYPAGKHVVLNGHHPEGVDTFQEVLRMGEAAEPRPDPDTYRAADVGDRSQHAPFILYTSGTTGMPKAIMLRDSSQTLFMSNSPEPKEEMVLVTSPLCWVSAHWTIMWSLRLGTTRVLYTVEDPLSLLSTLEKYKINTWLAAPPTLFAVAALYKNKCKDQFDLSSVRMILMGGSKVDAVTHIELEKDLECKIFQGYASTETGSICGATPTCLPPPGALGILLPGVEMRLVNADTGEDIPANAKNAVGEVRVRSKYLMLGYYNNPEANEEAFDEHGFYKTGDLLYEDEKGQFHFVDRIKEVFKHKGLQVAPAEVEAVLLQHPGVKDACVLGRASPLHGELPTAFVSRVESEAGEALTEAELQAVVAEKLADHKRLRGGVIFLDQLPKTATGKIARSHLKKMLWEKYHENGTPV